MDKTTERPEYGTLEFFQQHLARLIEHQHELDPEYVREEKESLTTIIEKLKQHATDKNNNRLCPRGKME